MVSSQAHLGASQPFYVRPWSPSDCDAPSQASAPSVNDRLYDASAFISAYLDHRRYITHTNELGAYHHTRYAALVAVFGVDVERPLPDETALGERVLWELFHDAAARYLAESTPFEGIMEAPRIVGELMTVHARRLAAARGAVKRELLAMQVTIFGALYGEHPAVSESALYAHGFAGGPEPNPYDFD